MTPAAGSIALIEIEEGYRITAAVPAGMTVHEGDAFVLDCGGHLDSGRAVRACACAAGSESPPARIVRRATLQDQATAHESQVRSRMALQTTRDRVAKHKLVMKLVRVRFNFDRALLMVWFTAEERVDFRGLIKDLAGELRCRVEMRQIGVRDEAALVGGMGVCGRPLCCASWLKTFAAINVKMARTQGITLNPVVISGQCGRLKCCLGYEHECYRELGEFIPLEGTRVECVHGPGRVIYRNILYGRIKIALEDGRVVECTPDELRWVSPDGPPRAGGTAGGDEEMLEDRT